MYITTKKTNNIEYRVYPIGVEPEGQIIYKGHKLGVDTTILEQIIDWRIERSVGRIYFPKYDKVKENISIIDASIWDIGRVDNFDTKLVESWETVQNNLKSKIGNYSKIIITKTNI